jgi:hypothetical protein
MGAGLSCRPGRRLHIWNRSVLSIKNSLPLDTFGLSFFLAAGAGFAIWALGRKVRAGKRNGSQRLRARQKKTHSGGQIDLEKA